MFWVFIAPFVLPFSLVVGKAIGESEKRTVEGGGGSFGLSQCVEDCGMLACDVDLNTKVGCNQMFNCAQACKMRDLGLSRNECSFQCRRDGASGCFPSVRGWEFELCAACNRGGCSRFPSVDECETGCALYNQGPTNQESDAKHQITRCETSSLQKTFNCEKAYNGDTTTETTKGFINGWAYRGKIPSWVVFYLDTSVTTNTIIFKTALKRADHHLNDFSIEVRVGTKFEAVAISRVNIANANIKGNRVETNGEDNIRVAFQPKKGVTAIKLTAFGSDASNENSVINDIHVLFLADINMDWAENDVDGILNKIV